MFKKTLLSLSVAMACMSGAMAAEYYVLVPVASPAATTPTPSQAITVTLSTTVLPAAKVNTAYAGFDFKNKVTVSGDSAYDANNVTFSATGLPSGMALSSAGVLSGTPTVENAAGAGFNVIATYKTKTGQQAYTLVVNGVYLAVTQISAGFQHTCAVTTSGGAKCWGLNNFGQLGDGSTTQSLVPVDVAGLTSGVASITSGEAATCAVTTSGGAKCWGLNGAGQLGNNSTVNSSVPVDVTGMTAGVASISMTGVTGTGNNHVCAVTTSGGAKCWGVNNDGQLGNNSLTSSLVPVDVSGLTSGVASIVAGGRHTCAVTTSGGAKCWGYNMNGQLGDNTYTLKSTPVDVSGLNTGVASVALGHQHTCAVTTAGGAKCWGLGGAGQLGRDSTSGSKVPVDVSGLTSGVISIDGGYANTCAVTTSGGAKCWGDNGNGQLGTGSIASQLLAPTDVSGLTSGVASISIGGTYHACAVLTTGGAKCWGKNFNGQLGNNSTSFSLPTSVVNP